MITPSVPPPRPGSPSSPPPGAPPAHHRIESILVTGGYLHGAQLHFADGLNCIIGGRGSGKTTVLELIRFAIGAPAPKARVDSLEALVRANLSTGVATARVRTQHGVTYQSSRAVGESPRVTTDASSSQPGLSLDGELFKIEVYSQNQIESIAQNPRAQLTLIDKFVAREIRGIEERLDDVTRRLDRNATASLALAREIETDEDKTRELPSVTESLRALEKASGGDAGEAARAHAAKTTRARERAAMSTVTERLGESRAKMAALADEVARRLSTAVPRDLEDDGDNRAIFAAVGDALRRVDSAFAAASREAQARIDEAERACAEQAATLTEHHAAGDAAYEAWLARHNEDRGRALERQRLHARFLELSSIAARLEERQRAHAGLREERKGLLASLQSLREERFALRQRVTRELSESLNGDIRVSITHAGSVEVYEQLLGELLRGANVRPASFVRDIARSVRPDDLCAAVEANDPSPIVAVDDSKTGKVERAQRILDALRASGRAYELQTVPLDDVPLIELRTGNVYKPSAQVSTGQRCTCILPILLLRAASPLLIDQPEDNLDNAFIYDVLLRSIIRAKRARQLIFVTHNPNIPVLGDAERVFVLESDGEHGRVVQAGTVDEVRVPIERILEGGREAFIRRGERYGHGRG